MKKTLALLLALLMLASMMFVSCGENPPKETNDDNGLDGPIMDDDTDLDEEGEDPENEETDDETNKGTSKNEFEPASGTVYFLHAIKVRENASSKKKNYVGDVAFGTPAELIECNSTWSKVKTKSSKGIEIEGYVYNDVYTNNENAVKIDWYAEAKAAKIDGLGLKPDGETPWTLNVRSTPWDCGRSVFEEGDEYYNVNVLSEITAGTHLISDGKDITVKGATMDGSWFYIEYSVTVDGEAETVRGFCSSEFVDIEGEDAPDQTEGSNTPIINPKPV